MLSTYNKQELSASKRSDEQHVVSEGIMLSGLEWNQYIGRIIVNDFIKQLPQATGTEFKRYIIEIVPFIHLGLFDSAIDAIQEVEIPGLEHIKAWLIKSLHEGENREEITNV